MPDRTALLRCDDAAVAGAVAGRLRADGLRVPVVPASASPEHAVADAIGDSGALDVLVSPSGSRPRRLSSAPTRRAGTPR